MRANTVANRSTPASTGFAAGNTKDLLMWWRSGFSDPPPPIVKRRIVREYGRAYGARTLFETGTWRGDMLAANLRTYPQLLSVELSQELHEFAKARLARFSHIKLIKGDGAEALRERVAHLTPPIVYWLDSHYSGPGTELGAKVTPLIEELEAVSKSPGVWVTLIDDARLFDGSGGFPKLEKVIAAIRLTHPSHRIRIWNDVIRVEPRRG